MKYPSLGSRSGTVASLSILPRETRQYSRRLEVSRCRSEVQPVELSPGLDLARIREAS